VYTVDDEECTGCGSCLELCTSGAIEMPGGVAVIYPGLCTECGLCREACPQGAIYEYEEIPALQSSTRGVTPYPASQSRLAVSADTSALARREKTVAALVLAPTLSRLIFRLAARVSSRGNGGRRPMSGKYLEQRYTENTCLGGHRWRGGP
jgi:Fe-S-cluster-containing hydrogenase component 2